MSYVTYPANSAYATTPQTSSAIGLFNFRAIPANSGDTMYTLQPRHQYRPDLLSYELYGTPEYFWIFCARNPALRADPVWNFLPGLVIYVPNAQYLRRVVGS